MPMALERTRPPLVVRADANVAGGTGHLMRCLALAEAWQARAGAVHCVTCQPSPTLCQRIQATGAQLTVLARAYPAADDTLLTRSTLAQLAHAYGTRPWLILDGYHFDAAYVDQFPASLCHRLMIDDGARLPYYNVDVLVNHGVHAPSLVYQAQPSAWQLLGTRYALLRGEFFRWHNFSRRYPARACNVLVTLGGADGDNVTAKVIDALRSSTRDDMTARLIVGPLHPELAALRRMVAVDKRICLLTDVAELAPLMAWADLAIAAGGTTAWELAYMQVPTLLLILAENQAAVAQGSEQFGAARALGRAEQLSCDDIVRQLAALSDDQEQRARMGQRGRQMVDGLGAQRLVSAMDVRPCFTAASSFSVRAADSADSLLLWQWANDPTARLRSFHPEAIPWQEHEAWFSARLASATCRIWIMQLGDLPVGQIRYERVESWEGPSAEISFSIALGFRGMRLGTALLEATVELAAQELAVRWIKGVAFSDNQASHRAFLNARFDATETCLVGGRACTVFRRASAMQLQSEGHVSFH